MDLKPITALFLCLTFFQVDAQLRTDPNTQRIELGQVSWYRDYHKALSIAEEQGKSVLILFQEVPGCGTCQNYGTNVLSHPLMVEAIEHEFVPLVIYNNKGNEDRKILNQYGEPSWNNPVVRIVNAQGEDVIDRVAGKYTPYSLLEAMVTALVKEGQTVPGYVKVLGEELRAAHQGSVKEAYFKMYCFWSGEGHLGQGKGVVGTEPGFMSGHEVVKVKYDANVTSPEALSAYAGQKGCLPIEPGRVFRADNDPQYYLKHSPYKYLPLSELQKSRINSALGQGVSPEQYLSPTQKEWFLKVKQEKSGEVLYTKDLLTAWKEFQL